MQQYHTSTRAHCFCTVPTQSCKALAVGLQPRRRTFYCSWCLPQQRRYMSWQGQALYRRSSQRKVPGAFALADMRRPKEKTRLTGFAGRTSNVWTPESRPGSQRKLHDLKKVVSIKGGAINFDTVELLKGKEVLDNPESSTAEILDSLRRLSCFDITQEMLVQTHVGFSVRKLKHHDDKEISRIARALVEKWKAVIRNNRKA